MTPSEIGRYEIEGELGRGGMAVVYLARDPFMTREVAVKVLPAQLTVDPQFRARFQREAQVIAALDHPAIVPVYDFGEHEGRPYLVMRHMAGGSLANRLKKQGPLSVVEAARVLERVGSALDEAHQKGIIHRDLKPDNILFDDRGEPFVGDFGIVKISEATVAYTGSNVIGTPGYMSPEQVQGEEDIDGRTDVYALGAIAYEMLTGSLPYHSDTPVGLMMQHVTAPVPDILSAKPDLPAGCAPVIARAMAKSREERFATCTGVALALAEAAYTAPDPRRTAATVAHAELAETAVEPLPDAPSTAAATGVPDTGVSEEKSRGFPLWALAIGGCLGLFICGGAVAGLLGLGAIGGIFGGETPTSQAAATGQPTVTDEPDEPTEIAPSPVPEIGVNFSQLNNDSIGVTVSYPPDWYAEQDAEFIVVADRQRLIDDLGDFDSGAVVVIIADSRDEFRGESPTEMLQFAMDRFDLTAGATLLNGPRPATINGQDAASADLSFASEDGTEILAMAALVTNLDRAAFVIAATPAAFESEHRPTLQAIVNSVAVGEVSQSPISDEIEGTVAVGDVVAGTIAQGGMSRWNLVGSEGEVIDIIVEPQADDFDVVVDVLDDAGASILDGGEVDSAFGTEEILGIQLPYGGDYIVSVRGFQEAAGEYELSILASDQVAGPGGEGSLILASATLGSGQEHAFPFSAESPGAIVTASVDPMDDFDVVLSLYNDDDDDLIDEIDESFGYEELSVEIPAAGNYYFNVSGFDGAGGDYEISLAGPPEILFELALGDELLGQFDEFAQIDYYYSGSAGEVITVIAAPDGDLDIVIEVLSVGDGEDSIDEADDGAGGESEELTINLPEEALYIIRARGFAGQVGSFFLTLE